MRMNACHLIVAAACAVIAPVVLPISGSAHPGHGSAPVDISLQAYAPANVSIIVGDTVVWTWKGPDTDHSVTADPGQKERFDSDPGGAPSHAVGDTLFHTFTETGTFRYSCSVHPEMRGVVEVRDPYRPLLYALSVKPSSVCTGRDCVQAKLRVTSNEPATLKGQIERRKGNGWKRVQALPKTELVAAQNTVVLPTRGLDPGRHRVLVRARDGAGNYSRELKVGFVVRAD